MRAPMQVHVLLLRDQYDSALLGVFTDPETGRAAADRRFGVQPRSSWRRYPTGAEGRALGSDGTYLWLEPAELKEAS
jgi:hypothetical protein